MNKASTKLLISAPNNGGISILINNKCEIVNNTDTTGILYHNDKIYRLIQHFSYAELKIYSRENLLHTILYEEIKDAHDICMFHEYIYIVSTGTNEIMRINSHYEIEKKYSFDGTGDAWHLNCLVIINEKLCVSAFGKFKKHYTYKGNTLENGFLMEVESQKKLISKLSQPHTPVYLNDKIYICDSEKKSLKIFSNLDYKLLQEIFFDRYTRGLCVDEKYIWVGLSAQRGSDTEDKYASIAILEHGGVKPVKQVTLCSREVYNIITIDKDFNFFEEELYIVSEKQHFLNLQEDVEKQTSWAKELDEKNREKIETIKKLQDDVTQQTSWAKKLNENNYLYKNKIELLNQTIKEQENENRKLDQVIKILENDFSKMKRNNNLMFARLKRLESSRLIMFLERIHNLKEESCKVIFKKIMNKMLPGVVPSFVKKQKKNKFLKEMKKNDTMKTIVVFPIIAWGFRWQRPQHLLSGLAKKGYRIIYISKDFRHYKTTSDERKNISTHIEIKKLDENIYKLYLNSLTLVNIYTSSLDQHNVHWFILQLEYFLKKELEVNDQNLIYFVQFPNWLKVVQKIVHKLKGKIVFDCMDEHSGFSNVDKKIIEQEKELIKISDLVISSSNKLYNKNVLLNKNTIKIKNGTEFSFFNKQVKSESLQEYANKPIIGYYGAIAEWFDIELMEFCARERPDYNFIFIGSTFSCDITNIKKLPNVYFLGEKPYSELPGYLWQFDVCTIPFQIIPLIEATNPVKFYEYISAGKPVVSTKLPELEEFQDICYLATSKKEFLGMLDQAVMEKKRESNQHIRKKRIKLAAENSWDKRVELLNEVFHKENVNV